MIVLQSGQVTSRKGPIFTELAPNKKRFRIAWDGIRKSEPVPSGRGLSLCCSLTTNFAMIRC